jgi:hypothetical protein
MQTQTLNGLCNVTATRRRRKPSASPTSSYHSLPESEIPLRLLLPLLLRRIRVNPPRREVAMRIPREPVLQPGTLGLGVDLQVDVPDTGVSAHLLAHVQAALEVGVVLGCLRGEDAAAGLGGLE